MINFVIAPKEAEVKKYRVECWRRQLSGIGLDKPKRDTVYEGSCLREAEKAFAAVSSEYDAVLLTLN